jgi:hypothetical protein
VVDPPLTRSIERPISRRPSRTQARLEGSRPPADDAKERDNAVADELVSMPPEFSTR